MKSLFEASIYHKRFYPKANKFRYSGFYIKFSIDSLQSLKSRLFSVNRFNLFSFYEKDHGYRDGSQLDAWVRDTLGEAGLTNFDGKIILQTFPRVLGYVFNPVSFWYCYRHDELAAVICEVNNTFGESHSYVITNQINNTVTLPKEFHVSPFYDIKGDYEFDFQKNNFVKINYYFDNKLQLITSISGENICWNDFNLFKIFVRHPLYTIFVIFFIHYQAIKLFVKKNKYFPKPEKLPHNITYEKKT